jgi:hypothetical protein
VVTWGGWRGGKNTVPPPGSDREYRRSLQKRHERFAYID